MVDGVHPPAQYLSPPCRLDCQLPSLRAPPWPSRAKTGMTDEDLRRLSVDLICDLTCPDWPADPTEFEDLLGSLLDYDSERLKAVRLDEGVSSIRVLAARVIRMVDGDEERSRHTESFVRRLTGRDLDGWIDWVRVRRRR